MTRIRAFWHRFRRRPAHRIALFDELAQCRAAGLDYDLGAPEWDVRPHANDNHDTLFRTVPVPHEGRVT